MNGLKFHWSNPKFAGLPWSCDKKKPIAGKKKHHRSVKRGYSLDDVREETARLRADAPGFRWSFKFCGICQGLHVLRH